MSLFSVLTNQTVPSADNLFLWDKGRRSRGFEEEGKQLRFKSRTGFSIAELS